MKNISFAVIAVCGLFCLAISAPAQNPVNPPILYANPSGIHENVSSAPESLELNLQQDSLTLDPAPVPGQVRDSAVDTELLREPSIYRKISRSGTTETLEGSEELLKDRLSMLSATYRPAAKPSAGKDCMEIARSEERRVGKECRCR